MFNNNQASGASAARPATSNAPAPAANLPQQASTPPTVSTTQQPQVQAQQQPPGQFTYTPPHPAAYGIPFFHIVGPFPSAALPSPHHPHHHPQAQGGGGNMNTNPVGQGNTAQGAPSSLIDPMLSMSDGGEGMSEDEGASAGVKNGPPSTGGNNGINSHGLDDDDFNHDAAAAAAAAGHPGGQGMSMAGSAVDENGQPLKKKRRRQALSCTECKRRKIKCDRQNPCSPCTRRGEADRCHWVAQEPIPDMTLYSASEKFVTRAEYEHLQQKVLHLESIVATLAPRAFLGGLEALNLQLGPPPFGLPPPPGHPGGPQHPPYVGGPPPDQQGQQPGGPQQQSPFPPGPHPPIPTAEQFHALQQAYQAQMQAYAAGHPPPVPQHPQQQAKDGMEVDANAQQPAGGETSGQAVEMLTASSSQEAQPTTTVPAEGPKPQTTAAKMAPKSRKRKDRAEGEEGADDAKASPSKGRAAKPRSKGAQPPSGLTQTWDPNAPAQEQGAPNTEAAT